MRMDPSPTIGPRCWRQSLELLPKVGTGAGKDAAEELIQRVDELVAVATRLRGEKEATKDASCGLRHELDTEQTSTETAARPCCAVGHEDREHSLPPTTPDTRGEPRYVRPRGSVEAAGGLHGLAQEESCRRTREEKSHGRAERRQTEREQKKRTPTTI